MYNTFYLEYLLSRLHFVTSEPYPIGTKCSFTWQSSGQAVRLTTSLRLEPRSQMMQSVHVQHILFRLSEYMYIHTYLQQDINLH